MNLRSWRDQACFIILVIFLHVADFGRPNVSCPETWILIPSSPTISGEQRKVLEVNQPMLANVGQGEFGVLRRKFGGMLGLPWLWLRSLASSDTHNCHPSTSKHHCCKVQSMPTLLYVSLTLDAHVINSLCVLATYLHFHGKTCKRSTCPSLL